VPSPLGPLPHIVLFCATTPARAAQLGSEGGAGWQKNKDGLTVNAFQCGLKQNSYLALAVALQHDPQHMC